MIVAMAMMVMMLVMTAVKTVNGNVTYFVLLFPCSYFMGCVSYFAPGVWGNPNLKSRHATAHPRGLLSAA